MQKLILSTALVLFLSTTSVLADVESGPTVGEKVNALKVYAVTGKHENKSLDYVADRKGKPTIYVFVQAENWSRPMARFLRTLDKKLPKISKDAYVVAVWLTDDVKKSKEYLPRAQQSLQLENTAFTCYEGKKTGPETWGINTDAHCTVVVTGKGKIATTKGYLSINATDVSNVEKALKKAIK